MALKKIKPTTPGQRHKLVVTNDDITATKPEKSLVYGIRKSGGRNNQGKMTMRYIGGGHKQLYRFVDFKRTKDGIPATVKTIEYDPNRSSRIALICYADGEKSYILCPQGLKVGQTVMSGKGVAPEVGNTLLLSEIPFNLMNGNALFHPTHNVMFTLLIGYLALCCVEYFKSRPLISLLSIVLLYFVSRYL